MDSENNNNDDINSDTTIDTIFDIVLPSNSEDIEENIEHYEEIKNTLEDYLKNYLDDIQNIEHYPSHTYIKDNEVLTIFYSPEGELIVPTYLIVDYNNIDLRFILDHNNKSLFTEEYAYNFSKYITEGILPHDVEEYIDELNGIEKTPMCKEELLNLKPSTYDASIHTSDKCQICLENFSPESEVIELNCKHVFCHNCIKTYFETYNNTCPMCRNEVGKKQKKVVNTEDIDLRQLAFRFINMYCERCDGCPMHKKRNLIIKLFISCNGTMDIQECIKIIKG